MIVIGLSWPTGHDNSVAVIQDGELVFAAEEERFTRHKHSMHEMVYNSLINAFKFLKKRGVAPGDVDAYALNFDPKLYPLNHRIGYTVTQYVLTYHGTGVLDAVPAILGILARGDYVALAARLIRRVIGDLGGNPGQIRIYPVEHHLAHAASAYYFSGYSSAAVLTIDGRGEADSTVIWKAKGGAFEKVLSITLRHGSIGVLWENIGLNLNFQFLEGPGKLMGLAPYGSDFREFLERLRGSVALRDGDVPYEFRGFKGDHGQLADYVTGGKIAWNPRGEIDARAAGAARAIQEFTNELFVHMGSWIRERTGSDRLALAGGVALNARANMELHYSGLFNDIFVFPAANDAGTTIGAAAYVYEHVLGGRMRNGRLRSAYLGPEYSDEEVKGVIERSKFRAEHVGDDVGAVADLVAKGKVVAWYQGRAELGPRALGNRSIVADPTRKE
ncbi:MAG: carbamoyltransferase N-terminal domain-containing protein, partial [Conexivisphaera sp.]